MKKYYGPCDSLVSQKEGHWPYKGQGSLIFLTCKWLKDSCSHEYRKESTVLASKRISGESGENYFRKMTNMETLLV